MQITDDHIKRLQVDRDQLDFDGIRRAGVDLLQSLSSKQWTDYNLHDPGITLLELLSYGLTDLVYRTDFKVADYLTSASGQIDYTHQALFPPQDIFPSQAITDTDYCKLIYDHIPEIDDVWIFPVHREDPNEDRRSATNDEDRTSRKKDKLSGLFKVCIKLHEGMLDHHRKSPDNIRQELVSLLSKHRTLCRDLHEIEIVETEEHSLSGEIEIDHSRPPAEIFAEIYFLCARRLSAGSKTQRFEDALANGVDWEHLLSGPIPSHGYIDIGFGEVEGFSIDVIKLIALIRNIPGVKRVKHLSLLNDKKVPLERVEIRSQGQASPVLTFPKDARQMQALRLVHSRESIAVSQTKDHTRASNAAAPQSDARFLYDAELHEQALLYLKKYEFKHHAFRVNHGNLNRLLHLPQGDYRPLSEYTSIGEQSPAIYGINHFGIPSSEPASVHARARQLKAYLYPFEQMMANYLASLQELRGLYSQDSTLEISYFSQFLGNREIPNIDVLYVDDANASTVANLVTPHDNFNDRRSRVLDHLLAIYGESFPVNDLRRFYPYNPQNIDTFLIDCKLRYLRHLCELSSERARAVDVSEPFGEGASYSSLQHKFQLLIGGDERVLGQSLLQDFKSATFIFVSDSRYQDMLMQIPNAPSTIRFKDTHPLPQFAMGEVRAATITFNLPKNWVCAALLQAGIDATRYCMTKEVDGKSWLCLSFENNNHGQQWWPITHARIEDLASIAAQMREQLTTMNTNSEGLHLLEHILLRPYGPAKKRKIADDFYLHTVSIILPNFTARFADLSCRAWIEELISQALPAHIMPHFFWLDYVYMAQFEQRYFTWMELLRKRQVSPDTESPQALDDAANQLIEFLKEKAHQQSLNVWL